MKSASKIRLFPTHKWKIAKGGLDGWDVALTVSVAVSHSIEGTGLHILMSSSLCRRITFGWRSRPASTQCTCADYYYYCCKAWTKGSSHC